MSIKMTGQVRSRGKRMHSNDLCTKTAPALVGFSAVTGRVKMSYTECGRCAHCDVPLTRVNLLFDKVLLNVRAGLSESLYHVSRSSSSVSSKYADLLLWEEAWSNFFLIVSMPSKSDRIASRISETVNIASSKTYFFITVKVLARSIIPYATIKSSLL